MKRTGLSIAISAVSLFVCITWIASATSLSGVSTFNIALTNPPFSFDSLSTSHRLIYELQDWSFSALIGLNHLGTSWDDLLFEVEGPWFEGGSLDVSVSFDPVLQEWEFLDTDIDMRIDDFLLMFEWHLESCVEGSYTRLRAVGSLGDVLVDLEVTFTGFVQEFSSFRAAIDLPSLACCDLGADVSIDFTCEGFEGLEIEITGVEIGNIPWLSLKASLQYTMDEKRLILSPIFDLYSAPCFDLFISATNTGGDLESLAVQDIYIEGIKLTCTIPPNTEVLSATALDNSANARMTGFIDYFEVISVAQPFTWCCDVVGRWQIYYYFDRTSTSLFDVGMIRFELRSTSSANHTSTGVDFRFYTNTGTVSARITLELAW
ncbi:hypothetical protein ACFLSG_04300 [Candidatus Bipolaricaulota bacterium]